MCVIVYVFSRAYTNKRQPDITYLHGVHIDANQRRLLTEQQIYDALPSRFYAFEQELYVDGETMPLHFLRIITDELTIVEEYAKFQSGNGLDEREHIQISIRDLLLKDNINASDFLQVIAQACDKKIPISVEVSEGVVRVTLFDYE
jgi:hypothetical protein